MHFIAADYLPEITAHVAKANMYLADHPEIEEGTNAASKSLKSGLGMAAFNWRGQEIATIVMAYRFYLLQRLQDAFAAQAPTDQDAIGALFQTAGLSPLLDLKTTRRVERRANQEVWGEKV